MLSIDEAYQQLKREMPNECAHYEKGGYADGRLLARATELNRGLRDKMYLDTLDSEEANQPFYRRVQQQ